MSILNFAEQDDLTQTHFCYCWVIEQIATHVDPSVGLTFVPGVVLELPAVHRTAALDAIKRAAMEGLIELRPDGGLSRFSQSELDAAPAAFDGSSLLWARAIAA
jgi:hypothetical protein